ncbi:uncharacterized protein LOC129756724 [Uranotaenia lowii]|uniref:uncharacterized protein LOC129756724 n=1 Tax=Uranotaenia lowii TaxID=190385 RepID=UPI00247A003C|nr:uncharacterized protein LOC129756724 [Uranotaenia lowii]
MIGLWSFGDRSQDQGDGSSMGRNSSLTSTNSSAGTGSSQCGTLQKCVVYLSVVALALVGLGYDPYQRILEQAAAAEAESQAEHDAFFTGIEEEAPEEEDLEINYQPNLYLGRIFGPLLVAWLLYVCKNVGLVRNVCGLGHLVISLCYLLAHLPEDMDGVLMTFGFISELFWSAKLLIYFYLITIYSPMHERLSCIIYGIIALNLGAVTLPWIVNSLEEIWSDAQYYLNMIICLLHLGMFHPFIFCKDALMESFEEFKPFIYRKLIFVTATALITLTGISNVILQWLFNNNETLNRPFQPFLVADDSWETFWNVLLNGVAFTLLGSLGLFLRTGSSFAICSQVATFLSGVAYFYYEEDCAARMAIPMTAFTFATALEILLELCSPEKLIPLLALVFSGINLAPYGTFLLIELLWSSPDIVLVVIWALNGFCSLVMLVLCRELGQRKLDDSRMEQFRDVSGSSFQTVITTIA